MKATIFVAVLFLVLFSVTSVFAEGGPEYNNALQSYDRGDYKEAVRIFKDYVRKKPDAAAYYRIGYGLYELGKYREAEDYFRQAYLIDPTFSPEPGGVPQKYPEKKIKKTKKTSTKKPPLKKSSSVSKTEGKQLGKKQEDAIEKAPSKEDRQPRSR